MNTAKRQESMDSELELDESDLQENREPNTKLAREPNTREPNTREPNTKTSGD
jgi:hypothetical protein